MRDKELLFCAVGAFLIIIGINLRVYVDLKKDTVKLQETIDKLIEE